jgi:hypothetical protein
MLAVTTVAAMAVAAPSAFGQEPVEVVEESSEVHCADVTPGGHVATGGCALTATGSNIILRNHGTHTGNEAIQTLCNNSFAAVLDENGSGYVQNQVLSGANCFIEPCSEGMQSGTHSVPWPATIDEEGGQEILEVNFCISPAVGGNMGIENHCEVHIPIADSGGHNYVVTANDAAGENDTNTPECELTGSWAVSGDWAIIH